MNDLDKILKNLASLSLNEPIEKTPDCPEESLLDRLASKDVDEQTREKLIPHIISCPYCSLYLKACLESVTDEDIKIAQEVSKDMFPLEEDIQWDKIEKLFLYKIEDKSLVEMRLYIDGYFEVEISSLGTYAIKTAEGQYLWSWTFKEEDLKLTTKQLEEIKIAAEDKGFTDEKAFISEEPYKERLKIEYYRSEGSGFLRAYLKK